MKKLIMFCAGVAMMASAYALTWGSVSVSTSLSTALSSARSQGKLLFVVTGTSSCPHCTDLKNAIGELGSLVTDNYVVYYCDNTTDPGMRVLGGVPQWGIFNPNTFNPDLRWNNVALFRQAGFSKGSTAVSSAINSTLQYAGIGGGTPSSSDDGESSARPTETKLAFYIDMDQIEEFPAEIAKKGEIIADFLPTVERPEYLTLNLKQKMVMDEKIAVIKYVKRSGEFTFKGGKNYSCLKLTYNKKKHTFTGSFKIYALSAKGILSKTTVSIKNGQYADGVGTATATLKKVGSWPVVLKTVEEQ